MLKKIKNILNTMGDAFVYANAGEMLPKEQKNEMLCGNLSELKSLTRVVLAVDEEISINALEYAVELCKEKNAILDLLYITPKNKSSGIQLE